MHSESKYLYRTSYTLLTAKNPLKVTHHGAKEHGDPSQRGTDEPSEDDRVALRLVGRYGPVVRQLPPELRGPLRGRSARPVDRLRPARPRTPRRPDRQWFRVRGPGGTPRRGEGGCRPYRDRKSTRLNSSHLVISYAVFCLKKKKATSGLRTSRPPHRSTYPVRRPPYPR